MLSFTGIKKLLAKLNKMDQTTRSDKYVNSPYNFNMLSSRQVMRIKKIINQRILFGYNIKFSGLANKENVWSPEGGISFQVLGVKGLNATG